jgi:hypothetical protein
LESADVRAFLRNSGVNEKISNLVLSVFPQDSFKEHYTLFTKAIENPSNLRNVIIEFEAQLGLGLTSHIAIVAREMLDLTNFSVFTRDYIKRCGDLVEHFLKVRLIEQFNLPILNKSLGSVVYALRKNRTDALPLKLLDNLRLFDLVIYRPAKHSFDDSGRPLFSIQDAVAVTFVSIRLCQQMEQVVRNMTKS